MQFPKLLNIPKHQFCHEYKKKVYNDTVLSSKVIGGFK